MALTTLDADIVMMTTSGPRTHRDYLLMSGSDASALPVWAEPARQTLRHRTQRDQVVRPGERRIKGSNSRPSAVISRRRQGKYLSPPRAGSRQSVRSSDPPAPQESAGQSVEWAALRRVHVLGVRRPEGPGQLQSKHGAGSACDVCARSLGQHGLAMAACASTAMSSSSSPPCRGNGDPTGSGSVIAAPCSSYALTPRRFTSRRWRAPSP